MEDLRLTKRLTQYWNRLRHDLPLPQWEKFNAAGLEDIWGQCCVWRVEVGTSELRKKTYTYEYVGTNAKEALGNDPTGVMFISNYDKFPGARIAKRVGEVAEGGKPLSDEGSFVNEKNRMVKYRSCLLPFGTKEGKVTHIVLGLSWRAF